MPRRPKTLIPAQAPATVANGNGHAGPDAKLLAAADFQQGLIRIMNNDRLLFQLWGELRPDQMAGILKQAAVGNLVWQERLFQKMVDEWPRLEKNILSLKRDVANLNWTVEPFSLKGEAPTDTAQEKAALVERALFGMTADPTLERADFTGMLKDLVDAVPCCFSILEVNWTTRDGEVVPQNTRKIPARFYGYGLLLDREDQLLLNPLGNLSFMQSDLTAFPANKFLVGVYKSNSNHPTMAALLRALTPYYMAQKYGLKWFMVFAQLFGIPMRYAEYTPGDTNTFNQLCAMLEQMGSANWGVFPAGAKVELLESKTSTGTQLPQRVLIGDADEQCDIMILGQTLTSTSGRAGGNRALGDVHADTERKVLDGVADFVMSVINTQLVPAILALNYGETSECPKLAGSTEEPQDELALAQRDAVLFGSGPTGLQLPVAKDFLYSRHSVPEPAEDAELYTPTAVGQDEVFGPPPEPVAPVLPFGAGPPRGGVTQPPGDKNAPEKAAASAAAIVTPSMQMSVNVKRGLDLRKKIGRGGSLSAVTRARDIAERKPLNVSTVKRMQLYFDANPEHAKAPMESPEGVTHLLHGGNAGKAWVEQVCKASQVKAYNESHDEAGRFGSGGGGAKAEPEPGDTVQLHGKMGDYQVVKVIKEMGMVKVLEQGGSRPELVNLKDVIKVRKAKGT